MLLGCGFEPHPPPLFTTVQDWSATQPDLHAVWGASATDVFAAGAQGHVYHYDGVLWTWMGGVPTDKDLSALWGRGAGDLYAVGSNAAGDSGVILHFDGTAWQVERDSLPMGLTALWGAGAELWAAGLNGALYHKSGAGDWTA